MLTIRMPVELRSQLIKQLKARNAKLGETKSEFIRQAIHKHLAILEARRRAHAKLLVL